MTFLKQNELTFADNSNSPFNQLTYNQAFCQANGLRANKNARCIYRHLLRESSAAPWLLTINVSQSDFTGNSCFSFGRFRSPGLIGNRTQHAPYSMALLNFERMSYCISVSIYYVQFFSHPSSPVFCIS